MDFSVVVEECSRLRKWLQRVNDSKHVKGPLDSGSTGNTKLPFALILGNHSSGKSSFINYLLGAEIQASGVAPTDDCFTIIKHGTHDMNRNGSAVVGDPDLGFHGLAQFGPMMVHKTQLKVRANINLRNMMIVDSPGMIDAPISETTNQDKPGTTYETLHVLTHAILDSGRSSSSGGSEQKLLLILNKADRFKRVHDYARTYGSLCWNLAKVIPRKDLPQIHVMCVPISGQGKLLMDANRSKSDIQAEDVESMDGSSDTIVAGFSELEETRSYVITEVLSAPKRRVDNEVSRLSECVNELLIHYKVTQSIVKDYRVLLAKQRAVLSCVVLSGAVATAVVGLQLKSIVKIARFLFPTKVSPQIESSASRATVIAGAVALSSTVSVAAAAGVYALQVASKNSFAAFALSSLNLEAIYQRLFPPSPSAHQTRGKGSEYLNQLWSKVKYGIESQWSIDQLQAGAFVSNNVDVSELRELHRMRDEDVPALRRRAAPAHCEPLIPKKDFGLLNVEATTPKQIPSMIISNTSIVSTPTRSGSESSSHLDLVTATALSEAIEVDSTAQ